jgi:two-component system, cell cycle sensor histidine kinase PleC
MGFSEVMEKEVLGPIGNDLYREYAGNIYTSGNHLLQLINEILDLSRIEAGRYDLHEETIRLTDIAEDCQRLVKIRAEAKGLQLVEDFEDDLAQVWADPRALRQIVLNLLSNALKFTPKGGRVTLSVTNTADGGQILTVRDTGPGIPKDEIPKVLQAFGQGSLAHESAEGGTGLGLPIVQNLIQLHGGTFELKSELRKGTEVSITLPRQRVLNAVAPLQPLGQERHKATEPLPRSTRQPRLKNTSPYGQETPYRAAGRA